MNKLTLSVASVLFPSLNSNLDGMSIDIFLYGCNQHCKGCHNLELQEFKQPNHSIQDILDTIEKVMQYKPYVVTIMGGEPLDGDTDELLRLIEAIKSRFPALKVSLYTGYNWMDIPVGILKVLDYLKTGGYDETKPSEFGSFLATTNQVMYKKDSSGSFLQQYPYEQ